MMMSEELSEDLDELDELDELDFIEEEIKRQREHFEERMTNLESQQKVDLANLKIEILKEVNEIHDKGRKIHETYFNTKYDKYKSKVEVRLGNFAEL